VHKNGGWGYIVQVYDRFQKYYILFEHITMYIGYVGVPNDRTLVGEWWVELTGHCLG